MGIRRTFSRAGSVGRGVLRHGRTALWRVYSSLRSWGRYIVSGRRRGVVPKDKRSNQKRPEYVPGRRIRIEHLHKAFAQLPAHMNDQTKSLSLGSGVLRTLLGNDWFDRHIMSAGKRGVLTVDESSPEARERSFGVTIDLAEVIYNLQDVPNFDECMKRLYEGNIEGTLAELAFARMLYINQAPFRFIVPQGVKKRDYDFEILYPGNVIACADAKCKIEGTDFTEKRLLDVLKQAREQLPNESPGIAFVKVPSRWLADPQFAPLSVQCARRFLGGVRRIVSVKWYSTVVTWNNNMMMIQHAYKEISNSVTDFGNNVNWNVFKSDAYPPEWNGAPPHWQRIFYFPGGKPR
jgi:hypothetical protein